MWRRRPRRATLAFAQRCRAFDAPCRACGLTSCPWHAHLLPDYGLKSGRLSRAVDQDGLSWFGDDLVDVGWLVGVVERGGGPAEVEEAGDVGRDAGWRRPRLRGLDHSRDSPRAHSHAQTRGRAAGTTQRCATWCRRSRTQRRSAQHVCHLQGRDSADAWLAGKAARGHAQTSRPTAGQGWRNCRQRANDHPAQG